MHNKNNQSTRQKTVGKGVLELAFWYTDSIVVSGGSIHEGADAFSFLPSGTEPLPARRLAIPWDGIANHADGNQQHNRRSTTSIKTIERISRHHLKITTHYYVYPFECLPMPSRCLAPFLSVTVMTNFIQSARGSAASKINASN